MYLYTYIYNKTKLAIIYVINKFCFRDCLKTRTFLKSLCVYI